MAKTVKVVNNKIVVTESQPDLVIEYSVDNMLKEKGQLITRQAEEDGKYAKISSDISKRIADIDVDLADAYSKGAMTDADYKASQVV